MLPIGTMGRSTYRPYVTFLLIVLNVLVFLVEMILMARGESVINGFLKNYALAVCEIGQQSLLITLRNSVFSMFIHGSLLHITFNMVFLWIFGPRVEAYFGSKRYLTFYMVMGVAASFIHALLGNTICDPGLPNGTGIVAGASGAIAGVMGAYLFLYPSAKIRTLFIFRLPIPLPVLGRLTIPYRIAYVSAWMYLLLWVIEDIINLFTPDPTGVAHWAHIGGFLLGLGVAFVATLFMPHPKVDPFESLDA